MQGPIRPDLARPDQRPLLLASACQRDQVRPSNCYGGDNVDRERSRQVYEQWIALTHPAPDPNKFRYLLWHARPNKPTVEMFVLAEEQPEEVFAPVD